MNNIINKFLLAGDRFMPEMHSRQPKFVYNAYDPFTRHKERIKEFKRTGDTRLLYRNELDKACSKHDAAYAEYKDIENGLISDQKLRNSAYDIASNPKCDGYQRGLASMVYRFFDSKVIPLDRKTMSGKVMKNSKILAEELHISNMNAVGDTSGNSPNLKNDGRMHVYLSGNYFKQDKTRIPNNNNAINIYCVYKLNPIASSRDTTFTTQNALLETCKLLKMLILQNMTIKDMVYVLMKEASLVIQ